MTKFLFIVELYDEYIHLLIKVISLDSQLDQLEDFKNYHISTGELLQKLKENDDRVKITPNQKLNLNDFISIIDYLNKNGISFIENILKYKYILILEETIRTTPSLKGALNIINEKLNFLMSLKNNNENENDNLDNLIKNMSRNWKIEDNLIFDNIYKVSNEDLFEELFNFDEELKTNLIHPLDIISYNFKINVCSINDHNLNSKIHKYLEDDKDIQTKIQNSIRIKIKTLGHNIIEKLYNNFILNEKGNISFNSEIEKYMKSIYNNALISTIIQYEEFNIITNRYIYRDESSNKDFDSINQYYIDHLDTSIKEYSNQFNDKVVIDVYIGTKYPCVIRMFKEIDQCLTENTKDYTDNEKELRENANYKLEEYAAKKSKCEDNIKAKFNEEF
eukprot:jgi/Orpsp1_1/1184606/evm.model.c7180000090237.1